MSTVLVPYTGMHYPQLYKTRTLFVSSNPREKSNFGCKTRIKKMLKQLRSWTEKGPSNLHFFFFLFFFLLRLNTKKSASIIFDINSLSVQNFFFCIVRYLILLKAQNNKLWFNFIIKSANFFIISIYVNILNDVYCHVWRTRLIVGIFDTFYFPSKRDNCYRLMHSIP